MFYTPPKVKRDRIIELWSIMKYLGRNGIDEMILTMHQGAKHFAKEIGEIKGFYFVNDIVFNQGIIEVTKIKLQSKY